MVASRRLPEGSLSEKIKTLVKAVQVQFNTMKRLRKLNLPVCAESYNRMLGALIASMYVTSAQGRCKAIRKLSLAQVKTKSYLLPPMH